MIWLFLYSIMSPWMILYDTNQTFWLVLFGLPHCSDFVVESKSSMEFQSISSMRKYPWDHITVRITADPPGLANFSCFWVPMTSTRAEFTQLLHIVMLTRSV